MAVCHQGLTDKQLLTFAGLLSGDVLLLLLVVVVMLVVTCC